ncbi:MAG: pimeloyl-ACP methyl ester carboxylesterase [Gammaproteobacteria bacterium]|jgi:pimeloyl-ACP methyl ester carboxylesterase
MEQIEVSGLTLDVGMVGDGPPLLFLHPEFFFDSHRSFIDRLSEHWRVITPRHPGFDGRTPPENFRTVDDLAYLYLDLIETLQLDKPLVVGASFGGWIAMEMAVRNAGCMRALSLLSPLGVKLSSREERDFADVFVMPVADALQCMFAGPGPDRNELDDESATLLARDRKFVAYYAWKPWLHNPVLSRWLHRANVPTQLVWGAQDAFASAQLAKPLAQCLPQSKLHLIDGAGHYPQLERCDEVVGLLRNLDAELVNGGASL